RHLRGRLTGAGRKTRAPGATGSTALNDPPAGVDPQGSRAHQPPRSPRRFSENSHHDHHPRPPHRSHRPSSRRAPAPPRRRRPAAHIDRRPAARPQHRAGAAAPQPQPATDAVTITVTVTLPAGTGDVETALLADEQRTGAQRLVGSRDGRTTVAVNSPNPFAATGRATSRSLPPRGQGRAAVPPLRPRRTGVVSPNSPARRDAEAARRRALQATAVSPSSPSAAPEDSLVIDLFGRR